ncbi:ceramidase family protein [Peziza echinospora]|nr:ceramidase family protein [Peziza echinospora]
MGGGSRSSIPLLLLLATLIFTALTTAIPNPQQQHRNNNARQTKLPRGDKYTLGLGKSDITGPVVEIGFMGYASTSQKGTGLRQRLYSRAFLVANPAAPAERIVYIIADIAAGDTAIRYAILKKLDALYPGVYTTHNFALVGTHSHAGPGAWMNYLLPTITTLGVDRQSFDAIVEGVVKSVQQAHEGAKDGYLYLGRGLVEDAGVNRSPYSYEHNPAEERAAYESVGGQTDKEMTVLVFEDAAGGLMGLLNWFPTHGTSLYNNNTLVAGDNKGYAALKMESILSNLYPSSKPITGFSQANMGDVSPNTLGPICQDTGLPCTYENSTCAGKAQMCHGRGPGFRVSDVESCRIIGDRQVDAAKRILEGILQRGEGRAVKGGTVVKGFHKFVQFGSEAGYVFKDLKGVERRTCKAALGFGFAAGTTDGPGFFDFTQNSPGTPSNPLWLLVRDLLRAPSPAQISCHKPKPILLSVGEMDAPYAWSPNIVDIQHLRVGPLIILISSGEATTMAGRRWRKAVLDSPILAQEAQQEELWSVLGGPGNTYSHYITTPEEYDVQRYEGASTLYGRHTLDAYIHATLASLHHLLPSAGLPAPSTDISPLPPIIAPEKSIALNTGVVYDNPGLGRAFGQVLTQPNETYSLPSTGVVVAVVVQATFVGANPRNNLRLNGDYVVIETRSAAAPAWARYRGDADYDVTFHWKRKDVVLGTSEVVARWDVGGEEAESFRVRYFGDAKAPVTGKVSGFVGTSRAFRFV